MDEGKVISKWKIKKKKKTNKRIKINEEEINFILNIFFFS
jgi:hypothetical protein